jgi:nitroreductase
MDLLDFLKSKRSVKQYQHKSIDHNLIEKIVEAGLYAPSGRNSQDVKMLVVENEEVVRKIAQLNASVMGVNMDPFYGAPVVIVVFADKNCHTHIEDGSLVMANLMLEAHALGVDSCWIHRAKETFLTVEGRMIAQNYGIPDNYEGIGNCILGYYEGNYPIASKRKENRVIYIK